MKVAASRVWQLRCVLAQVDACCPLLGWGSFAIASYVHLSSCTHIIIHTLPPSTGKGRAVKAATKNKVLKASNKPALVPSNTSGPAGPSAAVAAVLEGQCVLMGSSVDDSHLILHKPQQGLGAGDLTGAMHVTDALSFGGFHHGGHANSPMVRAVGWLVGYSLQRQQRGKSERRGVGVGAAFVIRRSCGPNPAVPCCCPFVVVLFLLQFGHHHQQHLHHQLHSQHNGHHSSHHAASAHHQHNGHHMQQQHQHMHMQPLPEWPPAGSMGRSMGRSPGLLGMGMLFGSTPPLGRSVDMVDICTQLMEAGGESVCVGRLGGGDEECCWGLRHFWSGGVSSGLT